MFVSFAPTKINSGDVVQYFYDGQKKGVAHIWDETDTFCGVLAILPLTGEITRNKRQRQICQMCQKRWTGWMGLSEPPKQSYNASITTL